MTYMFILKCALKLVPKQYTSLRMDLLPLSRLKKNAEVSYDTLPYFYKDTRSRIEENHNIFG